MRIKDIQTFHVDAGWRSWLLVKVETDDGVTGWGECSDDKMPLSVAGAVEDFKAVLIGRDPRPFEMRFQDMVRRSRQSPDGAAAKAISGIELALVDIKARALGISVVELFGGPTREDVRLYWSHCGTSRIRGARAHRDPAAAQPGRRCRAGPRGRTKGLHGAQNQHPVSRRSRFGLLSRALPANPGTTDQAISNRLLTHIESLVGTLREAVGPDVDINLDLNFNFKPEACRRIARVLEPFNLLWLENRHVRSRCHPGDQAVHLHARLHR